MEHGRGDDLAQPGQGPVVLVERVGATPVAQAVMRHRVEPAELLVLGGNAVAPPGGLELDRLLGLGARGPEGIADTVAAAEKDEILPPTLPAEGEDQWPCSRRGTKWTSSEATRRPVCFSSTISMGAMTAGAALMTRSAPAIHLRASSAPISMPFSMLTRILAMTNRFLSARRLRQAGNACKEGRNLKAMEQGQMPASPWSLFGTIENVPLRDSLHRYPICCSRRFGR